MTSTTRIFQSEQKHDSRWTEDALRLEQNLLQSPSISALWNDLLKQVAILSEEEYAPSLYICHAESSISYLQWVKPFLDNLLRHLKGAGFTLAKLSSDIPCGYNALEFYRKIEDTNFVIVIGTEAVLQKAKSDTVIQTQLAHINRKRVIDSRLGLHRVIPILLSGDLESSLPAEYEYIRCPNWKADRFNMEGPKTYLQHFLTLVATLYSVPVENFDKIVKAFLSKLDPGISCIITQGYSKQNVIKLLQMEKEKVKLEESKNNDFYASLI